MVQSRSHEGRRRSAGMAGATVARNERDADCRSSAPSARMAPRSLIYCGVAGFGAKTVAVAAVGAAGAAVGVTGLAAARLTALGRYRSLRMANLWSELLKRL